MNNKFIIASILSLTYFSNFYNTIYAIPEIIEETSTVKVDKPKDLSIDKDEDMIKVYTPTKLIKVPYINQNEIVFGCEAVSSTMLLQYYGYKISEKDFTDNYLIKKDWYKDENGNSYGPDPNAAYPGNPYIDSGENCGFGSYAPATAKSIDKILDPLKHESKITTGQSLIDLTINFINKGIPVLIWITMDLREPTAGRSWIINYIDENSPYRIGDTITWIKGEHCVVFVGYDDNNFYFNDSYNNHGVIAYEKKLVNQRFLELGKQSVAILNKKNILEDTQ